MMHIVEVPLRSNSSRIMTYDKRCRRHVHRAVALFGRNRRNIAVIALWRDVSVATIYRWLKDSEQNLLLGPERKRALKATFALTAEDLQIAKDIIWKGEGGL